MFTTIGRSNCVLVQALYQEPVSEHGGADRCAEFSHGNHSQRVQGSKQQQQHNNTVAAAAKTEISSAGLHSFVHTAIPD